MTAEKNPKQQQNKQTNKNLQPGKGRLGLSALELELLFFFEKLLFRLCLNKWSSFFNYEFAFISQNLEILRFLIDKACPDGNILLQKSPKVRLGLEKYQARSEGFRQGLGLF